MITRRIEEYLQRDLKKKMVFLSGPRQCGKTTLAKNLLTKFSHSQYYSWDIASDRKLILQQNLSLDSQLWIFDEIHKFRRWRNFLKGIYDEHHENCSIFVTGSARLNLYGRGGDSLQGRYFPHHLHPFTLSEVLKVPFSGLDSFLEFPHEKNKEVETTLLHLLEHGGFPETFLESSMSEVKRWQLSYSERLIEEEIRSLEQVRELDRIELLLDRLDECAGSIISLNSLREDLDVSFDSVRKWLMIFEKIYACFRISPYGAAKIKAVKKEQKLYLWDWARAKSKGAQFENLMAVHLLRFVDFARDLLGEKVELRFFRHRDGTEVDFIVLRDHSPWIAMEVKLEEQELSRPLRYLVERIKIPYAFQIFLNGCNEKTLAKIGSTTIRSISAARFLLQLP